jgi:hypothetical protein
MAGNCPAAPKIAERRRGTHSEERRTAVFQHLTGAMALMQINPKGSIA